MSTALPFERSHPGGAAGGRHRAPRRPGRRHRVAVAALTAGAPLASGMLLAAPAAHAETDWDALAQCESGGDWGINTGNGFGGGLQFTDSTWKAFGGSGQPEDASRAQQIRVAERVKAAQGMNAWPTCSKKTGQTSDAPNASVPSGSKSDTTKATSRSSGSTSDKASSSSSSKDESETTATTASPSRSASSGSYTVRQGDTLSEIAASHGTTWRALQSANSDVISDPNMIMPGQTIDL